MEPTALGAAPPASPPAAVPRALRVRRAAEAAGLALLLAAPGAAVALLAFEAGGFFAGTTAAAALVALAALAVRVALAPRPTAGFWWPLALAAAALAGFAGWVLASGTWSDAPGRALLEYDRALLYVVVLVLFGSVAHTAERLRVLARWLTLALVGVCAAGLAVKAVPDLVGAAALPPGRLSWPFTYWNALGLAAALAGIGCGHLACDAREPLGMRALGAAGAPVAAATLVLAQSRGAIVALAVGVVAYLVLARPRGALTGAIALAPSVAAAAVAWRSEGLLLPWAMSGAADQGRTLFAAVALCSAAAFAFRALSHRLDLRLVRLRLPARVRVPVLAVAYLAAAGAAVGAALAVDLPERALDRIDGYLVDYPAERQRGNHLVHLGANGRLLHWEVALSAYESDRLRGTGAGTYALEWQRERERSFTVFDGHGLFFEVLGELGLVGLALLALALVCPLAAAVLRARGPDRAVYALVAAIVAAWAAGAAIDWHWEMPALTLGPLALAGAVLAARPRPPAQRLVASRARWLRRGARVGVVAACAALAVLPVQVGRSQAALDDAGRAYDRGDCRTATEQATAAIAALPARPEGWELRGYCALRRGDAALALREFRAAEERDPGHARLRYAEALALGAAGRDPRPAARAAHALNPLAGSYRRAHEVFAAARSPRGWRRAARTLPRQPPTPLRGATERPPAATEAASDPGGRRDGASGGRDR